MKSQSVQLFNIYRRELLSAARIVELIKWIVGALHATIEKVARV